MSFAPKNILVPVDADPTADRALADGLVDDAAAFAKVHGARLTLLFVAMPVVTPQPTPEVYGGAAYRAMLDVAEARQTASLRVLKELVARVEASGVKASPLVTTRSGAVAQVIVDVAGEEKADLVMMTTHGRRGINRLLLGSVAERVAHLSAAPVLLLRPAG